METVMEMFSRKLLTWTAALLVTLIIAAAVVTFIPKYNLSPNFCQFNTTQAQDVCFDFLAKYNSDPQACTYIVGQESRYFTEQNCQAQLQESTRFTRGTTTVDKNQTEDIVNIAKLQKDCEQRLCVTMPNTNPNLDITFAYTCFCIDNI